MSDFEFYRLIIFGIVMFFCGMWLQKENDYSNSPSAIIGDPDFVDGRKGDGETTAR